ncbi:MAG: hypothetical protein F6K31_44315 [Symploca sp. SIO2G7]|nr:hypothetical protein [Symploca sp. SIO2G7]
MASRKRQSRTFSGMSYREVQRSNLTRRSRLPKTDQIWLKANGYKNVGWDNVTRLYQKINELLAQPDADDEPTLEQLFLEADRIGQKYQTPEEIEAFNQQMNTEVSAISDLIDQQFPETEVEVIDYSQTPHSRVKTRRNRKRYY